MRFTYPFVAAALLVPMAAFAQQRDSLNLRGRSSISAGLGLTGAREASTSAGTATSRTSGELGWLAFRHWTTPSLAVEVALGVLSADATATVGQDQSNVITSALLGIHFAPTVLAPTPALRPYVSAFAGSYMHNVNDATPGTVSTLTETTAGARLAAGADWFAGRHFVMGLEGDYHAVGHFDHPDALTSHASGFGMSLSLGFAWGGR